MQAKRRSSAESKASREDARARGHARADASARPRASGDRRRATAIRRVFAGVACALCVPTLALAASHEVDVYRTDVGFDTSLASDVDPSRAAASATWTDGNASGSGSGLAEAGFLNAALALSAQGNGSPTQQVEVAGGVFLRMIVDDVVVTGPASEVSVALNVSWGGDGSTGGTDPQEVWNLIRECTARLDGTDASGGTSSTGLASQRIVGEGTIDSLLTTSSNVFAVGVPLTAEITLDVSGLARAGTQVGGEVRYTAFASADFSNFASFSIDGPVFDLPPGFTANSLDGRIVDNVYVPEPNPAAGLAAGLLAMTSLASRRLRRGRS